MIPKSISITALAIALQACSTSAPSGPSVGVASVTGGTALSGFVNVSTHGTDYGLPVSNGTWGAAANPTYTSATALAGGYQSTNALAIAGRQNGSYFAGVNGTQMAPPNTGTAALTGEYYAVDSRGAIQDTFLLNADFGAGTISGTSVSPLNSLNSTGTISGTSISGTVNFNGKTGTWAGGFYDPNNALNTLEVSGAFVGTDFAGVMYGLR